MNKIVSLFALVIGLFAVSSYAEENKKPQKPLVVPVEEVAAEEGEEAIEATEEVAENQEVVIEKQ